MTRISAIARQPDGKWQVLRGPVRASLHSHPEQTSFFAPTFDFQTPAPWLVADESSELTTEQLRAEIPTGDFAISIQQEPDEAAFHARHQSILEKIARGEFQKVVPAVFARGEVENLWPFALKRLGECDTRLLPYGFFSAREGMIGATPEILFEKSGKLVRTQAVAGTAPLNGPSLLDDKKEQLEHNLVIEDLVRVLSPLGRVGVSPTEERPAGAMKHLVTDLSLRLESEVEFADLARRLHPSAALGGFPRGPAAEWLQAQSEYVERRRFGAPFGWCQPNGDGVCLVAIRNVQWQGTQALIGSGCGVVAGSQADKEWRELALKRAAIFKVLGLEA